ASGAAARAGWGLRLSCVHGRTADTGNRYSYGVRRGSRRSPEDDHLARVEARRVGDRCRHDPRRANRPATANISVRCVAAGPVHSGFSCVASVPRGAPDQCDTGSASDNDRSNSRFEVFMKNWKTFHFVLFVAMFVLMVVSGLAQTGSTAA